jgi:hypothetical protein
VQKVNQAYLALIWILSSIKSLHIITNNPNWTTLTDSLVQGQAEWSAGQNGVLMGS